MQYEDFYLRIDPPRDGRHPVTVHSPAGDGSGWLRMPAEVEELRSGGIGAEEMGGRLFEALFTDQVRALLEASLTSLSQDGEKGLRLKLCLDLEFSGLSPFCGLPWELIYWKEKREFLCLGRKTPLVRYINVPRAIRPPLPLPLNVLLVSACPAGMPPLAFMEERQRIEAALLRIPGVVVHSLLDATPQNLRAKLLEESFHALHFMGHGTFQAATGQGAVWFEGDADRQTELPGWVLANLLRDATSLRLVFLNACQTASSTREAGLDPFTGVATALVMAGVPAVLAMRTTVLDVAAIRFSEVFYQRIAAGDPVDAAATEGRMALHLGDPGSLDWATPVLFLRAWDGHLFEPVPSIQRPQISTDLRREIIDTSRLIRDKTEGFVGRRWVFDAFTRFTHERSRGYFILRGDPGIGKTALTAQMVKSQGYVHHFNVRNEGIQRPEQFLRNVCAQLMAAYGLEGSLATSDATQSSRFLNDLLERVASRLQPEEKAVLLVDALDESDLIPLSPGANVLYLPGSLPTGVFVVATTRRVALPLRIDCDLQFLDIEQDSVNNLEDIREYVIAHLVRPGIQAYITNQHLDDKTFVTELVAKSQGNFMYLRHVLPEIERGAYQERLFEALPVGLLSYYEDHWRRMRLRNEADWFAFQLPVLLALTVVRQPVSFDLIEEFSGQVERRWIRTVLQEWDQFLYTAQEEDEEGRPQKRYRLYHESFYDFVAEKDEVADERIDLKAAHARIADVLWRELYGAE